MIYVFFPTRVSRKRYIASDVSRGVSICQNVTEIEDKGGGGSSRAASIVSKQKYSVSDKTFVL